MPMNARALLALLLALAAGRALAHGGNPDVFFEGSAGPYRLFVTVRPPPVIPGVAEVRVRAASPAVTGVEVVPLPATGPGAQHAPRPDVAERSAQDPQHFRASLWLMTAGAWQVRVTAHGPQGAHTLAVPVRALPTRTTDMPRWLGVLLGALALLLALGLAGLARAAAGQAVLAPGLEPGPHLVRAGRRAFALGALAALAALALGRAWFLAEDRAYEKYIYKPLQLEARAAGGQLELALRDPGWLASRRVDDLVPDHEHLMHLFVARLPELERVWHLHPERVGEGRFTQALPALPAGRYALFAEVVHATGLAETLRAEVDLPAQAGAPLVGDDSTGRAPRVSDAALDARTFSFEDGTRVVWVRPDGPLRADAPARHTFRLLDAAGERVPLEPYMGMLGHAAVVRWDLSRFAHVHPSGTPPAAALALAEAALAPAGARATLAHAAAPPPRTTDRPAPLLASHAVAGPMPSEVGFPYAFPEPGRYRLFVQLQHAGAVRTATFDVNVLPASPADAPSPLPLPAGEHEGAPPPAGAHPSPR